MQLSRDQAKEYILDHCLDYFTQDKGHHGYVCPVCQDGAGGQYGNNGITTKDKRHFTCWSSGCFTNADIFEIVGKEKGLTEFREQLEYLCEYFRITIDNEGKPEPATYTSYKKFYQEAHSNISKSHYIQDRGISEELIEKFNLGYIEKWKIPLEVYLRNHPDKTEKNWSYIPESPRLIIPVSDYGYTARDTRADVPKRYKANKIKCRDNVKWTFNATALKTSTKPIFILEGEIDALSIMQVGGEAVAVGSVAYIGQLVEFLQKDKPQHALLLALDTDKAGVNAQADLKALLDKEKIRYYEVADKLTKKGIYKDANEHLMADKQGFKEIVDHIEKNALRAEKQPLFYEETATSTIASLKYKVVSKYKPVIIPTGFTQLDSVLNGGLRAGLYGLGAISSLGKTSYLIQIADNIIKSGKSVLYASLEMSREELVAKILSRNTYLKSKEAVGTFNLASSTIRVLDTDKYSSYQPEAQQILAECMGELAERGSKLYILQGVGSIGVAEINSKAQAIAEATGDMPVIMIDYLQLLAPYKDYERSTDKQIVDKNIMELKRMSRDLDTPVVVISSFNRESYKDNEKKTLEMKMTGFKESGAIEYSVDCLIGLYKKEEPSQVNGITLRHIECTILKNRSGENGKSIDLFFIPLFNHLYEKIQ